MADTVRFAHREVRLGVEQVAWRHSEGLCQHGYLVEGHCLSEAGLIFAIVPRDREMSSLPKCWHASAS